MQRMTVLGYPVIGEVTIKSGHTYPVVDIPMMSDERWQQLSVENAISNYTHEVGHAPENAEVAVQWQRDRIAKREEAIAISQQDDVSHELELYDLMDDLGCDRDEAELLLQDREEAIARSQQEEESR